MSKARQSKAACGTIRAATINRGEIIVRLRRGIVDCVILMALSGAAFVQAQPPAHSGAAPRAAGIPPTAAPDQAALLHSDDPKLAANKKLVFDMWRAIIQGAHTELAPQYFTESYIQHNPNVATGRDAIPDFPSARAYTDSDNESPVDLGFTFGDVHFRVLVAKYLTAALPGQVFDFYRKPLARYGEVLE